MRGWPGISFNVLNCMKSFLSSTAALLALCVLTSLPILAQPTSGGPTPGTPAVDPTQTPIDGGISLLLAGGVGYGLKQLRARRAARQAAK
ncbi:MAG: hypothetical protein JWR44_365 [Hymenobacter sp.]|jgi:hypothetical protein|nr:hypothetical protein [Hymenobacter sp.]